MTQRIDLRPAGPGDEGLLLTWRNDEETRRWSLQTDEVDETAHARWFKAKLEQSGTTRIYIAEVEGRPVGQARLDRQDGATGEISVGLDAQTRGMGLGTGLIRSASAQGVADLHLDEVIAVIKVGNEPSVRAFARAGYELVARTEQHGAQVWVYRLDGRTRV